MRQQLTTECAEAKAALKIVEQDNHELRDEVETFWLPEGTGRGRVPQAKS